MSLAWSSGDGAPGADAGASSLDEITVSAGPGAASDPDRAARDLDPEMRAQDALDRALRYLGRRDRSESEVRTHLEGKRVEPDAIDAAIAELSAMGYVDDARYAQRFAEDRRALDAWGYDRIARALAKVHIAPEHVEAALAARDVWQEREAAEALLRRRFPGGAPDDRTRSRALGLLVRRGYDSDLAYEAVRTLERDAA